MARRGGPASAASWAGSGANAAGPTEGYLTRQGAQREVDAILADARVSRIVGRQGRVATVTFEEAAREWLRYVEFDRKRRPATIKDYRWIVEKRLLPEFGKAKLEGDHHATD